FREHRHKGRQLALEHQRQKITSDRVVLRQAFVRPDQDLTLEPERLAIDGRADDRRDVVVTGDEVTRHDHVETWFVAALRHSFAGAIDFAALLGFACSFTHASPWILTLP